MPLFDQRNERPGGRHDGVSQRLRHAVAVAGRAGGGRIGAAAGGEDDRVRRDVSGIGLYARYRAVFRQNFLRTAYFIARRPREDTRAARQ